MAFYGINRLLFPPHPSPPPPKKKSLKFRGLFARCSWYVHERRWGGAELRNISALTFSSSVHYLRATVSMSRNRNRSQDCCIGESWYKEAGLLETMSNSNDTSTYLIKKNTCADEIQNSVIRRTPLSKKAIQELHTGASCDYENSLHVRNGESRDQGCPTPATKPRLS